MKTVKIFFGDIGFCVKIAWGTSKLYTLARICIQVISSLLPLSVIIVTKQILDTLISGSSDAKLVLASLIFIYLFLQLSIIISQRIGNYLQQMHDIMLENHLNRFINKKSAAIDISYYDRPSYYDKLKLMRTNSSAITKSVWDIVNLVSSTAIFITAFIVMVDFSILWSAIIVVSYVPVAFCEQLYIKKIYNWQVKNIGEERKLQYIADILVQKTHAKEIRVFSIAAHLIGLYSSIWSAWFAKKKSIMKKWSIISMLLSCIPQVLTAFVLVLLGQSIIEGQNSIGDFSLYSGMIAQLISSLFLVIFSIAQISDNKLKIKDYREFQDWENTVEGTGEVELQSIETIEFDQVSFMYPGNKKDTISDFNFSLSSKEKIALVGVNGAGKSTLVKLLLRFYDATRGRILINGTDIRVFTPESIRKCYSVMFQDYTNYAFTIRDNIKISNIQKPYEDSHIMEICKLSGVEKIINRCEKGLDTYLFRLFEENGEELSGGENQKIALARTFFRDGDIIIMDEPSSSLDPESEHELFEKMVELGKGKGIIMITHKLSNVAIADRIVVIENGKVHEDGSHEELMRKDGRYAELYRLQAENYVDGIRTISK
ncbi:MAG: ABC transporter ATP-binding protein/permease [Clostridiales bacterium]|nr:ABC transporter ATP-binding protein/permease [Clostridiales bacterium]